MMEFGWLRQIEKQAFNLYQYTNNVTVQKLNCMYVIDQNYDVNDQACISYMTVNSASKVAS